MGRLTPKTILIGLFSFAILIAGCSEEGLPTGPNSGDTELTSDTDGTTQDNSDTSADSNSNSDSDSGENSEPVITEYSFDGLHYDCGWDPDKFPNPYGNMSFDERPRWGTCSGLGVGLMTGPVIKPMDSRYYRPDVLHTTVAHLDEPVDEVSVLSANERGQRSTGEYYSALTAYDEDGNEIDIDENGQYYVNNSRKASLLTVTAGNGKRIHSIGITSYQNATFFDDFTFTVKAQEEPDTTPPELHYTVESEILWPPDHTMQLAVSGISATDDRELADLSVSVSSSEPVNGEGDGNTEPDWEIVRNDDGTIDVFLRAERSGQGNGRVYTVSIHAEDAAGNPASAEVEVEVPHDMGNGDNGNSNANNGSNGNGNGNGG